MEHIHDNDIVHRDIKPENFLIGTKKTINTVFTVDYGLSRRYRNSKNKTHIQLKYHKSLTGTARYASINAHLGLEQSRRDDLEAIGYVLIYFLMGGLPWQNIKQKEKSKKYKKIMKSKMETNLEILLQGYPDEFVEYMDHVKFEDKPNYRMLRKMFYELY